MSLLPDALCLPNLKNLELDNVSGLAGPDVQGLLRNYGRKLQ